MSEMVERVAFAIAESYMGRPVTREFLFSPATHGQVFVDAARAAIAAMREPTEAMISAGNPKEWGYLEIVQLHIWRTMTDAALSTKASEPDTAHPDRHTSAPALP